MSTLPKVTTRGLGGLLCTQFLGFFLHTGEHPVECRQNLLAIMDHERNAIVLGLTLFRLGLSYLMERFHIRIRELPFI